LFIGGDYGWLTRPYELNVKMYIVIVGWVGRVFEIVDNWQLWLVNPPLPIHFFK